MGDPRITPSGWLPPVAPGSEPRPRREPPRPAAPAPPEAGSQAGWALVLAIGALTLLLLSLGSLFVLTLPCSVAAWVLAARARGAAAAGDRGRATAALWLARIGVFAGMAAALVFIALLASGFDFERFRDDLQRELDERRDRPSGGVRATVEGLRAAIGR